MELISSSPDDLKILAVLVSIFDKTDAQTYLFLSEPYYFKLSTIDTPNVRRTFLYNKMEMWNIGAWGVRCLIRPQKSFSPGIKTTYLANLEFRLHYFNAATINHDPKIVLTRSIKARFIF